MKRAGCHTVMMGVESADPEVLATYEEHDEVADVRAGFARAKRNGLRTVGAFISGRPEETERSIRRFYFRPSYLWRRVKSAASLYELRAQAREGLALLFRNV